MEIQKKTYTEPILIVHGDVEAITQNGSLPNADVPGGNNGTANSPA